MIHFYVIYASNGDMYLYHSPGSPRSRVAGSATLLVIVGIVNLIIIERNLWQNPTYGQRDCENKRAYSWQSIDVDSDVAGVT
jgi:hypothetical protein